jgi:G:T/U-mismatch repair DNA glycosylase
MSCDVARLRATLERYRPDIVAVAFEDRGLRTGRQPRAFAGRETWVLPSTSGLAVRYWDIGPWRDLARTLI